MNSAEVERELVCVDCQKAFIFSEKEQSFYRQRGVRSPDRCLECRAVRRAERNADLIRASESEVPWTETLGHYGGAQGASAINGSRRNGNGGYPAVCGQCGKDTVVPFEPRRGRPVYCRDCFKSRRSRT